MGETNMCITQKQITTSSRTGQYRCPDPANSLSKQVLNPNYGLATYKG